MFVFCLHLGFSSGGSCAPPATSVRCIVFFQNKTYLLARRSRVSSPWAPRPARNLNALHWLFSFLMFWFLVLFFFFGTETKLTRGGPSCCVRALCSPLPLEGVPGERPLAPFVFDFSGFWMFRVLSQIPLGPCAPSPT